MQYYTVHNGLIITGSLLMFNASFMSHSYFVTINNINFIIDHMTSSLYYFDRVPIMLFVRLLLLTLLCCSLYYETLSLILEVLYTETF